jgi:hypothetical protein
MQAKNAHPEQEINNGPALPEEKTIHDLTPAQCNAARAHTEKHIPK